MQKARRYQNGRKTEVSSLNFGSGVLYTLIISIALWILLLLTISLVEWLMPNIFGDFAVYVAATISIISMGLGAYLGSRRLSRMAVWLACGNGIICWLIGLCIAWCSGIDITVSWIMIAVGICLTVSVIGALLGVLRVK